MASTVWLQISFISYSSSTEILFWSSTVLLWTYHIHTKSTSINLPLDLKQFGPYMHTAIQSSKTSHVYIIILICILDSLCFRVGLYFFPTLYTQHSLSLVPSKVVHTYLLSEWMTYWEASRCRSPGHSRTHCCGKMVLASDSTDRKQLLHFGNC